MLDVITKRKIIFCSSFGVLELHFGKALFLFKAGRSAIKEQLRKWIRIRRVWSKKGFLNGTIAGVRFSLKRMKLGENINIQYGVNFEAQNPPFFGTDYCSIAWLKYTYHTSYAVISFLSKNPIERKCLLLRSHQPLGSVRLFVLWCSLWNSRLVYIQLKIQGKITSQQTVKNTTCSPNLSSKLFWSPLPLLKSMPWQGSSEAPISCNVPAAR